MVFLTLWELEKSKKEVSDLENEISHRSRELDETLNNLEELRHVKDRLLMQLKTVDRGIENFISKVHDLSSTLENLNLRLGQQNKIIFESVIVEAIIVDGERNNFISNGLVDLNRDVLMRLVKIIRNEKKIRDIIGMTTVFYSWSKSHVFCWARAGCNLYFIISNLRYPITPTVLQQVLQKYGESGSVKEILMITKKRNYTHALVRFSSLEDAFHARKEFDGRNIYDNCCTIEIRDRKPKIPNLLAGENIGDNDGAMTTLLFSVSNVQILITTKIIRQILRKYDAAGAIGGIEMLPEVDGVRKEPTQAFVRFYSVDDAQRALEEFDGRNIFTNCCHISVQIVD